MIQEHIIVWCNKCRTKTPHSIYRVDRFHGVKYWCDYCHKIKSRYIKQKGGLKMEQEHQCEDKSVTYCPICKSYFYVLEDGTKIEID